MPELSSQAVADPLLFSVSASVSFLYSMDNMAHAEPCVTCVGGSYSQEFWELLFLPLRSAEGSLSQCWS